MSSGYSTLDLARLEFAITTSLHWLFVLLTLGLVTHVAILQTRWAITGKPIYEQMTRYWGQLYLINYALGIGTGIVMELQFGLNWSGLSGLVGNVIGAPLAIETIIVFFLESTFLGMWIFGWRIMPRWAHTTLIWLVLLTAYASAFFVMAANGFLQHPVGFDASSGTVRLTDFGALFTNPTFVVALPHVLSAALLTGSMLMLGISAAHLLRKRSPLASAGRAGDIDPDRYEFFRRSLRQAMPVAWIASFLAIGAGFPQFAIITKYQPTKFNDGPADLLPPAWIGAALGIMIGLSFIMWFALTALWPLLFRDWLIKWKFPLVILFLAIPLPFLAAVAGWVFREVGRQPWVVYGMLRTSDAISGVSHSTVLASLIGFSALLGALTLANWWLIARFAARGPVNLALGAAPQDDSAAQAAAQPERSFA